MSRDTSLTVSLFGRDVSMGKTITGVGTSAKSATKTIESMSRKATIALAGIAAAAKLSVDAASDFSETTSKVSVIFGKQGEAIQKFARTADVSFGLSQTAAMDAASTFATFGKSAGLSGKDLTGFSTKLVGLSSDLASFYNTSPEDAITAIGAALRGENEPIRRYGVLLDDASLRQQALAMGIVKTTKKALTPQQKVLAAQALIFKQTSDAQGDFKRTSGGLANQQRILTAQMTNMRVEVGMMLLPAMKKLVETFRGLIPFVREHKDLIKKLAVAFVAGATAIVAINAALKVFHALQTVKMFAGLVARWMGYTVAVEAAGVAAGVTGTSVAGAGVAAQVAWAPFLLTITAIAAAFVGIKIATDKLIKNRKELLYNPKKIPSWSTESNKVWDGTSMSNMPKHAKGGIVTKPHIGMIGEAGPEAIIPLNKAGMMGGITIINNIQGSVVTEKEIALRVRNDMAQLLRRKGLSTSILGV